MNDVLRSRLVRERRRPSVEVVVSVNGVLLTATRIGAGRHFVGRQEGSVITLAVPWASRVQLTLDVQEQGVVARNGHRTRLLGTSKLVQIEASPGGSFWVGAATSMDLTWPELPDSLEISIRPGLTIELAPILLIGQNSLSGLRRPLSRDVDVMARHRMAVLFEHLLLDKPRPSALYDVAARRLGVEASALRQSVDRMIRNLNRGRTLQLRGVDSLGHYLVFTSETLTPDDLQRPSTGPQ